ncbi:hypothetical protein GCM10009745_63020 [Kribbella yunnanensis]|uniref:Secreted protein n=1 Tax=Kribbella yunnanensis TaxID=190194 RepID=A0ABN2IK23_9ACTN
MPWWLDSALVALAGLVVSGVVTVVSKRTERRRLSRDDVMKVHREVIDAADRLQELPVWPVEKGSPDPLVEELRRAVKWAGIFGAPKENEALGQVYKTGRALGKVISEIRLSSSPGRRDEVDLRVRPSLVAARHTFDKAVELFVARFRERVEILGPYRAPIATDEPENE